jgi:transcriptional antiterminator NusG
MGDDAGLIDGASCPWPRGPRTGYVQGRAWYLLQASADPDKLREFLKRYGYEVYYPKTVRLRKLRKNELTKRQRADGAEISKPALLPVFPNYPFINFDVADVRVHELFDMAGVFGLHCTGERPVLLDGAWVMHLKGLEANGVIPAGTTLRELFSVGERVRVSEGPFAGYSGAIEALPADLQQQLDDRKLSELDESKCIRLGLDIFGRITPTNIPMRSIEKL